jgi:hypothetical protein
MADHRWWIYWQRFCHACYLAKGSPNITGAQVSGEAFVYGTNFDECQDTSMARDRKPNTIQQTRTPNDWQEGRQEDRSWSDKVADQVFGRQVVERVSFHAACRMRLMSPLS